MFNFKIAFSTHYADIRKKNKDVGMHPGVILEDDENYYVIHLTSKKIEENEYSFVCKNIDFGGNVRKYHECFISKNLANVPKNVQKELSNRRKFKIMKDFELENKKELLSLIYQLLNNNYFVMYNASFKRKNAKIKRDTSKEIAMSKTVIKQKIKDLN